MPFVTVYVEEEELEEAKKLGWLSELSTTEFLRYLLDRHYRLESLEK